MNIIYGFLEESLILFYEIKMNDWCILVIMKCFLMVVGKYI